MTILFSRKRGRSLLELLIIYIGVLSLQSGDPLPMLVGRILTLFGVGGAKMKEQFLRDVVEPEQRKREREFLQQDGEFSGLCPEIGDLAAFDDRQIRSILREIDTVELAVVLYGAASNVRGKILRNMSQRASREVVEKSRGLHCTGDEVRRCQQRILEIAVSIKAKTTG